MNIGMGAQILPLPDSNKYIPFTRVLNILNAINTVATKIQTATKQIKLIK